MLTALSLSCRLQSTELHLSFENILTSQAYTMSGMVAKGKIYDVFISYHESDKEWVTEQLLQHLEDENFSVCWDDRDFEPGKTIIENKLNGLCSSSCTVVVLTSKYGADEDLWTTLIEKCCVNAPEIIREFRLLPILLRQCKVPDLFAPLWKLDWTNKVAQKFFWKKLTQAILKNVTGTFGYKYYVL